MIDTDIITTIRSFAGSTIGRVTALIVLLLLVGGGFSLLDHTLANQEATALLSIDADEEGESSRSVEQKEETQENDGNLAYNSGGEEISENTNNSGRMKFDPSSFFGTRESKDTNGNEDDDKTDGDSEIANTTDEKDRSYSNMFPGGGSSSGSSKTNGTSDSSSDIETSGIYLEKVSVEATTSKTATDDLGIFTITFDATGLSSEYVSATTSTVFGYHIENGTGNEVSTSTSIVSNSSAPVVGEAFLIATGTTEVFTLTFTVNPDVSDSYRVVFDSLIFGDDAVLPYNKATSALPVIDFQTPYVYLEGSYTVTPPPSETNPFVLGGVTLTYDDANISQYEYVYPAMQNAGQVGTLYASTGLIDGEYMSWAQLSELASNGWDIGGHGVLHEELPELLVAEMRTVIAQSYNDLYAHSIPAQSFAMPFGAYDNNVFEAIAWYYNSARNYHHIALNKWPFNKYFLHVNKVLNTTTVEEVKGWIDDALLKDQWLVLVLHEVVPGGDPEDETTWSTENLEEILTYLNEKEITAKTIAEMLEFNPNLLTNASFENGITGGWTTSGTGVTIDSTTHGSYPSPEHSVKFVGGTEASYLFAPQTPVTYGSNYGVRFFVNTKDLTSDEIGFYMDEYDAEGNWISGQWLGKAGTLWVIDESYTYTPSSSEVVTASPQVYMLPGAVGTAYIDNIELFEQ
jgi:peptidoglycan/xylan/chitin deacetylase (PgdA/CDA1 family)